MRVVCTFVYPTTIDGFYGFVQRLYLVRGKSWKAPNGEELNIFTRTVRSGLCIHVTSPRNRGAYAVVDASDTGMGTEVVFLDGCNPWPKRRGEADEIGEAFDKFAQWMINEAEKRIAKKGKGKSRGPTDKVRVRAAVFRRLKDQHPGWSQEKVARIASPELEEIVGAQAVRNAYKAMGWKWQRADRVR